MVAGLLELAMWADNHCWPSATLTELMGTCTACDSGLAAPLTFMALESSLWLLVGDAGPALMLLGMARRPARLASRLAEADELLKSDEGELDVRF